MKVLVCGGREYDNLQQFFDVMDLVQVKHGAITCVVHGDAKGADFLARLWTIHTGKTERRLPADWKTLGRSAGIVRNQEMLAELPDMVIAFPGGTGTADMVRRSKAASIYVHEVTQ